MTLPQLIEQVRQIEGVRGVHIQAIEWESAVPDIAKRAGLLPRPEVSPADPPAAGEPTDTQA